MMPESYEQIKLRFLKGYCGTCHAVFLGPPSLRLRAGFTNTYEFDCPICRERLPVTMPKLVQEFHVTQEWEVGE